MSGKIRYRLSNTAPTQRRASGVRAPYEMTTLIDDGQTLDDVGLYGGASLTSLAGWLASDIAANQRPPGLMELNRGFLEVLLASHAEIGIRKTASEFQLSMKAVDRLVGIADRTDGITHLADVEFSFVRLDMSRCPLRWDDRERSDVAETVFLGRASSHRLALVQSMLIACITRCWSLDPDLVTILFASTPVEAALCRDAALRGGAWLSQPRRWIIASRLLERRLSTGEWGEQERYAAISELLSGAMDG